jgi:hypothetical protein
MKSKKPIPSFFYLSCLFALTLVSYQNLSAKISDKDTTDSSAAEQLNEDSENKLTELSTEEFSELSLEEDSLDSSVEIPTESSSVETSLETSSLDPSLNTSLDSSTEALEEEKTTLETSDLETSTLQDQTEVAVATEESSSENSSEKKTTENQVSPNSSSSSVSSSKQDSNSYNKDQITNSRLAADAGSMKKFSFRSLFGYSGGSLENPFARLRPNYRNLPDTPLDLATADGSFGLAYRLDAESSLRFNVGASIRSPLHNSLEEYLNNRIVIGSKEQPIFNISTPSLEYNRTFRSGNLMISPSVSVSISTDHRDTHVLRSLGFLNVSSTFILEVEKSKWMPGISTSVTQYFYKDSAVLNTENGKRPNTGVGLYPFVEYQFNELFAYRALFGFFNYSHYRGDSYITQDAHYISTGLSITPTRDIWIYPNFQVNPNNLKLKDTNTGVTFIVNL